MQGKNISATYLVHHMGKECGLFRKGGLMDKHINVPIL